MKPLLIFTSVVTIILAQTGGLSFAQTHNHGDHTHKEHADHDHAKTAPSHDAVHSGISEDGTIHIHNGWTRATVKTAKVGGGYLTIVNTSDAPDRLLSVEGTVSKRVELHQMKLVDNVMQMRPLPDGIEIPAGGEVVLKPGGEHIMFMGLKEPFQKGGVINVTLNFEKAGAVPVELDINSLAAKSAGDDDHAHHGSHDHSDHDHSGHTN